MYAGCAPLDLDVTFIGDSSDRSGNEHRVSVVNAVVDVEGAHFDGDGDYITVENFEYAADGRFTVAMWMTKTACTGGLYEYLYSHNKQEHSTPTQPDNPNVNIYIGCESSGSGFSTLDGSIIRYYVKDDDDVLAEFDYPLHNAGDFDAITALWTHVVLVVDATRVVTYDDGVTVPDVEYGFFKSQNAGNNAAYPHPGALATAIGKITMQTAIFIGARADLAHSRHFNGRIAGLLVSTAALTEEQVACVFTNGEEFLPSILQECRAPPDAQLSISGLKGDVKDRRHAHLQCQNMI